MYLREGFFCKLFHYKIFFLKGAATTAAGVGIVATASKTASAEGIEKHSQGGYRETKHVKTYYELAKF